MKKSLIYLTIFLLIATSAFAFDYKKAIPSLHEMDIAQRKLRLKELGEKEGLAFQHIPFGSSIEDTYEELKTIFPGPYDYIRIKKYDEKDYILFKDFRLGDRLVDIMFVFDHEQKLYEFSFYSEDFIADRFDTKALPEGAYLTEVFSQKYGKPETCFEPTALEVIGQGFAYLCKWKQNGIEIATQMNFHDLKFQAIGRVTMARRLKDYLYYKEQKTKTKAAEGAKGF